MFPKSLKNMLLLAVALLVITTGITVSQLVAHRYSASLLEGAAARAENMAHKLALEALDKVLINDMVSLQKMLDDQIASDPTVAYLFIVRDGKPLTHTFADGVPVHLVEANSAGGEGGRIEKIVSQIGDRYIDVAYPIFGGRAGTLRIGLSEAPYRRQVRQLWVQMSAITLGILVLSLLVSQWVISRLTLPLRQLTRYAEQIGEGNLDTRIVVRGRQEVSKLAAAFNSMLLRIQDHTQRLKSANAQLAQSNLELDRTHRQLKTSFSIARKISALARLDQICQFLIVTLKELVSCRNLNLLVFNPATRTINLAKPEQIHNIGDQDIYDRVYDHFSAHQDLAFIDRTELDTLHLAEWLGEVDQVALFPIRHHNLTIGAMIAVCSGDCNCIRKELDIVTMILSHAAGAIHRANLHEEELRELRYRVESDHGFAGIVGKDPKMQMVFKLIEDVSPTDATVLIQGESGTGKELVARAIHERSHRAGMPFVVINCSAYPSTLLESELFGHEKGAFTGALRRKAGRFEQADGGTVFLDEIGEIDPAAQTKLLRVLQQQTIDRLGGDHPIKVNVRILAATNKDLLSEVRKGNFREDLFYRLNVIPIELPPLRERRKDIHLLAQYFLTRFAREQDKQINGFRSEAMRKLIENPWPGNVRELENSIEHAVVLAKGSQIDLKDLPSALVEPPPFDSAQPPLSIVESEERLIRDVLEACDWNKAEAARQLGISRSTLYEKLKRFKILPPTLH